MYAAPYVEPAGAADTRRATSTDLTPYALAYVEPYGAIQLNAARGTRHAAVVGRNRLTFALVRALRPTRGGAPQSCQPALVLAGQSEQGELTADVLVQPVRACGTFHWFVGERRRLRPKRSRWACQVATQAACWVDRSPANRTVRSMTRSA